MVRRRLVRSAEFRRVTSARSRGRLGATGVGDPVPVLLRLSEAGPVWNQANTKQAIPSRNAAMPCLKWWVLDPAWWPGKKLGSDEAVEAQ